ncbi:hypothetical protein AKO1_013611 [Acrasis kona]|uniref:Uncharacterized protein n=1 Tax=Acrasis kona TaxID=1008807 RepID=A0AAW2YWD9_9EUKA
MTQEANTQNNATPERVYYGPEYIPQPDPTRRMDFKQEECIYVKDREALAVMSGKISRNDIIYGYGPCFRFYYNLMEYAHGMKSYVPTEEEAKKITITPKSKVSRLFRKCVENNERYYELRSRAISSYIRQRSGGL